MKWLTNFFNTSVGRKQLMALTGLMLGGFLVIHLSGNFLLLVGDGGVLFNGYAEWISGQFWINPARAGLLLTLIIHMYLAFKLSAQNRKARRNRYYFKDASDATLASRTMLLSGSLIFGFLIIHLFNFTWADASGPQGLYGVVLGKFTHPIWSGFYMLCMVILLFHLVHAIQSVFQTFGLNHPNHMPNIKKLCILIAIGLALGFFSIPLWLLISKGGAA